jgi:hypothetical protein
MLKIIRLLFLIVFTNIIEGKVSKLLENDINPNDDKSNINGLRILANPPPPPPTPTPIRISGGCDNVLRLYINGNEYIWWRLLC